MKTTSPLIKTFGFFILVFFLALSASAQEESTEMADENTDETAEVEEPFQSSYAAGVAGGLWALPAVDFAAQLKPWLGFNLAYNRFDFKYEDEIIETSTYGFGDQSMLLNGRFALQNIQLNANLNAPGAPWLRLQVGAAYNLSEDMYANFAFAESLYMNDFEIKPENVGTIEGRLEQTRSVYPFIGLAFGRLVPKKRIAFSLNTGAFYRGEPDITVIGTKMLVDNESNAEVLEENFSDFKWLPTLNLRLAIKIK